MEKYKLPTENTIENTTVNGDEIPKMDRRSFLKTLALTVTALTVNPTSTFGFEKTKKNTESKDPEINDVEMLRNIDSAINKPLFTDLSAREFFDDWCKMNDSIVPQFISREEWNKINNEEVLEQKEDGNEKILRIPEDLKLWEAIDIIQAIDNDTFPNKPANAEEADWKIYQLGQNFKGAGAYFYKYADKFEDVAREDNEIIKAREIAKNMAKQFFEYGCHLLKYEEKAEISDYNLTNESIFHTERWLLGNEKYYKRAEKHKNGHKSADEEKERIKTLLHFFKALARQGFHAEQIDERNVSEKKKKSAWNKYCRQYLNASIDKLSEDEKREMNGLENIFFTLRPWEDKSGPIKNLQDSATDCVVRAIELPEREIRSAVFRRGKEHLKSKIGIKSINEKLVQAGINISDIHATLFETLRIPELKKNLDSVRETGELDKIAEKEKEIALLIQKAVSCYDYDSKKSAPAKIISDNELNCVGYSVLGGGLLEDAGIKYLHVNVPRHALTLLITSDKRIFWQDMQSVENNFEFKPKHLTDEQDYFKIWNFAQHPEDKGLELILSQDNVNLPWVRSRENHFLRLYSPNIGQEQDIVNNYTFNSFFMNKKTIKESLRPYAFKFNKNSYILYEMGKVLGMIGQKKEAIVAFRNAIKTDEKLYMAYIGLGDVFAHSFDTKAQATECYRKAACVYPEDRTAFYRLLTINN